ncbi:MAG: alanine--tRNA ligase, partial [Alphaproteobacteria bacterium]|nr:alanine--tRNA ligase [Alphaproteobacteria bacterium]
RIATNANFWMMGDTGPCGPCSEIFFDQGDKLWGGPPGTKDEDGDRFLEFWNLVFMQFEQEPDGKGGYIRKPLPKPSIDTGMGLERTAALMQGKITNYDIDLLRDIILHSADLTGVSPDGGQAASHRVIADHLRASSFLIADGVMPSNEGRGYVLRRIMRRGMRHAQLLGAKEPLLYKLFPTLLAKMGGAYPELKRAEALITETLKLEEERFRKTLDRGLKLLDEEVSKIKNNQLPGEVAFKLYDTYGFPLDLTQDALKAKSITVDVAGFEQAMEKQKAEARKSWAGSGETGTEKIWFEILEQTGPTEVLGYETENAEGEIRAIIKDGKKVPALKTGEQGIVITNQTPFYGESGGQVGDTGVMLSPPATILNVTDTKKALGSLYLHYIKLNKGEISVGQGIEMRVDTKRRSAIRSNHSATHLLHEALRQVLGEHVAQKGSLQDAERTRFDISHPKQITVEELEKVEQIVNGEIRANTEVITRVMPLEEARESGAMALFGEKYDDEVRVVSMGSKAPGANKVFSVELCGGTHTKRTGDIGLLKITSESSLSSGVRRIEALTGGNALRYLEEQEDRVHELAALLKTNPGEVVARVQSLAEEKKKMEREISDLRKKLAIGTGDGGSSVPGGDVKNIGGVKFIGKVLEGFPAKDLKPMADDLKKNIGSGVVALVSTEEGKASIVVAVTSDLTGKLSAVDLVKIGAEALGGKGGGGRPDMAQAGGPNAAAANDAVKGIEKALKD